MPFNGQASGVHLLIVTKGEFPRPEAFRSYSGGPGYVWTKSVHDRVHWGVCQCKNVRCRDRQRLQVLQPAGSLTVSTALLSRYQCILRGCAGMIHSLSRFVRQRCAPMQQHGSSAFA